MDDDSIDTKVDPEIVAAFRQALREGAAGRDSPPYVATGRDAVMFRDVAKTVLREEMRLGGFRTEKEIQELAATAAKAVYHDLVRPLEMQIAKFKTDDQIRLIAQDELQGVGLRADGEHKFETRKRVESTLSYVEDRRSMSKDFGKELLKAAAVWIFGLLAGLMGYFGIKGNSH